MDWNTHLPSILAWGGSILTGLFTLLGAGLANKSSLRQLKIKLEHDSDKERKEALRQRLEELYSLVTRWAGEVIMHHVTYRSVMDGKISYNDALDIQLNKKSSFDSNRMFTLAELYFPRSHTALQELKSLRDEASAVHTEFKEQYRHNGQPSPHHSDKITEVLERFNKAVEKYLQSISTYAQDV